MQRESEASTRWPRRAADVWNPFRISTSTDLAAALSPRSAHRHPNLNQTHHIQIQTNKEEKRIKHRDSCPLPLVWDWDWAPALRAAREERERRASASIVIWWWIWAGAPLRGRWDLMEMQVGERWHDGRGFDAGGEKIQPPLLDGGRLDLDRVRDLVGRTSFMVFTYPSI